jgi:hypothetical protein
MAASVVDPPREGRPADEQFKDFTAPYPGYD